MKRFSMRWVHGLTVLAIAFASPAGASTNVWNGGSTDWGTPGNWGGTLPGLLDIAFLPEPATANQPDLNGSSVHIGQFKIATANNPGPNNYVIAATGGGTLWISGAGDGAGTAIDTSTGWPYSMATVNSSLGVDMASRTDVQNWNLSGHGAGNTAFVANGNITGTGTIRLTGGTLAYTFAGGSTASFNGDTVVNGNGVFGGTCLILSPTLASDGQAFRFGRNAAGTFGGLITLQNGGGLFLVENKAPNTSWTTVFENDVSVAPSGGYVMYSGETWHANGRMNVTGTLTLGGPLNLSQQDDWISTWNGSHWSWGGVYHFSSVTLNQSVSCCPAVTVGRSGDASDYHFGPIGDSAGTAVNAVSFAKASDTGSARIFLDSAGTFRNGTVVCVMNNGTAAGGLVVNAASGLAAGNLTILPGGLVTLNVAGAMTSGQTAYIQGNSVGTATLRLMEDSSLPTIASTSTGTIGLMGTTGLALNGMLAAGVGHSMFTGLGYDPTANNTATYTGPNLAPGTDYIYRLGTGGGDTGMCGWYSGLYFNSGTGTGPLQDVGAHVASLQVGAPVLSGGGLVTLSEINGFTGSTTISRGFGSYAWNSTLSLASDGALGSTNGAVFLQGGHLRMHRGGLGYLLATNAVKGALSFASESLIELGQDGTGQSFRFASNTRVGKGVLVMSGWGSAIGSGTKHILFTTPGADLIPNGINGMVAPYYLVAVGGCGYGAMDFATYNGVSGIQAVTYGSTDLATSGANDVVNYAGGTLGAGTFNAYALKLNGGLAGNPAGTTVKLASGGLLPSADIDANTTLDFNGLEAFVWDMANVTVNAKITNTSGSGLTKGGYGQMTLSNTNSDFTGTVTVDAGTLRCIWDTATGIGCLGAANNGIMLNGGTLMSDPWIPGANLDTENRLRANRTITLGPLGGAIYFRYWGWSYLDCKITGTGILGLQGGDWGIGMIVTNPTNDYSGGTYVLSAQNKASSAAKLGSGPLLITAGAEMIFQGDGNLDFVDGPTHTYLPVSLSPGAKATFTSASPVMGALTGCGYAVLGNTSLTVGKDNTDFTFYGVVSQSGGTGSLIKDGNGTFTLIGGCTFTGAMTVNGGALRMMGSTAGDLAVASGGALSGSGMVGGNLTVNGTFAVQLSGAVQPLHVTGSATFAAGSQLNVTLAAGFNPGASDFTVLQTTGGIGGVSNLHVTSGYVAHVVGNDLLVGRAKGTLMMVR